MNIDLNCSAEDDWGSYEKNVKMESSCDEGSRSGTPDLQAPDAEEIARRLQPGSILDSLDQAYVLYCEYARLAGFSVKKGTQSYFARSGDIKMKMYHCSCEGHPDSKASVSKLPAYQKQVTRTDCKARMRIVRERDGPWTVAVFHAEHNHELLGADMSYLLRSARNMTHAKKSILESLNDAGIGVSRACRWLEKEAGGRENLGFTRKDAYDHINRKKRLTKVENGDANALREYFSKKCLNEPYFFWKAKMDDEGRLMNFFFRDCQCADDYEVFGDVVSVDTTFKTNKYNLICAPFVGINHHRQNIMFGLAFLSDETTKSFQWLFKTFLESMKGKEPQVIFSDQDQAMMNGIDYTFRAASHRLCQWHINQNATAHFGPLNGNRAFKKMWYHCMSGCETEEEFDQSWQIMVETYGLQNNKWFKNMYNLRARWANVFTMDRFSAGLHATSRSEATNRVIKDLCRATGSLHEFVVQYEQIQSDWRQREREEDALCRGVPGQFVQHNHLLQHAARVYTRNAYKIFEREAANSISVAVINTTVNAVSGAAEYRVTSNCSSTKTRTVVHNQDTETVACTCRMMETEGMFCRHMMKVFYTINLPSLPEKHILKRWTRDAKKRKANTWSTHLSSRDAVSENVFVSSIMRRTYNMCMECKEDQNWRSLLLQKINRVMDELSKVKGSDDGEGDEHGVHHKTSTSGSFRNPREATHKWLPTTKQTNRRIKNQSRKPIPQTTASGARTRTSESKMNRVSNSPTQRNKRPNTGCESAERESYRFPIRNTLQETECWVKPSVEFGTQNSTTSGARIDLIGDGTDELML